MKVIVVYEDNNGMIAIAKNYEMALHFLLSNNWIDEYTEVVDKNNISYYITERFGENWKDTIFHWDINTFNDAMIMFKLQQVEIYEGE